MHDVCIRQESPTHAADIDRERPWGLDPEREGARARALPLEGMRVLDLCQVMAGPFCCMLLGDMGADVIKVEPPGNGDQTRGAMGFRLKGNDSLGFMNLNRNKRSIALDLKNQYGREAFYELVKTADVVVENYRPGVTARLGIDYETLSEIKPGLIYASISGFGQTGPWSDRPGFDLMAQAMTGIIAITGHPGQPPVRAGVPVADLGCGLFALYAVLSAYIGKQKTGVGQYIDASLFELALALTIWDTAQYWGTGRADRHGEPNERAIQAVKAKDGYFVLGEQCEALGAALQSRRPPRARFPILASRPFLTGSRASRSSSRRSRNNSRPGRPMNGWS